MKLNLLASYAYMKGKSNLVDWATKNPHIDFFLDSGAFTAHTTGKKVTVEEYAVFVQQHAVKKFLTLDVIGNPQRTMDQFFKLYQMGLNPMPIFTRGAPKEHLAIYYEYSNDIALGGIFSNDNNVLGYVTWFMNELAKLGEARTHWLGWSEHSLVLKMKPASYDNSSWIWSQRHRYVACFMKNKLHYISWHKIKNQYRLPGVRAMCEAIGFDSADLMREEPWVGKNALVSQCAAYSFIKYGQALQSRVGTKVYLVFGDENGLNTLWQVYEKHFKI